MATEYKIGGFGPWEMALRMAPASGRGKDIVIPLSTTEALRLAVELVETCRRDMIELAAWPTERRKGMTEAPV